MGTLARPGTGRYCSPDYEHPTREHDDDQDHAPGVSGRCLPVEHDAARPPSRAFRLRSHRFTDRPFPDFEAPMATKPTCLVCQKEMEPGFLTDFGHGNTVMLPRWCPGQPAPSWWT